MAVEARLSMYKRNNYMIGMAVLAGLALWFAYDGYFSEKFIEEHTLNYGTEEAQVGSGFFAAYLVYRSVRTYRLARSFR